MNRVTRWLNLYNNAIGDRGRFHLACIETSTDCNRRCSYCPVSVHPRSSRILDTCAIIDQLRDGRFVGAVAWGIYNEPLLTPNFKAVLEYARRLLPLTRHQINTNGDLLRFGDLRWYARRASVVVSVHDAEPGPWIEEWKRLPARLQNRVRISKPTPETAASRAGICKSLTPVRKSCGHYTAAVISATGHMLRCGDDYDTPQDLDRNVLSGGIFNVWRRMKPNRDSIRNWTQPRPQICAGCTRNLVKSVPVNDWLRTASPILRHS
jgi:2-deoxy-scyllo-inosamine dehydrogenase (SAM-dependent)